MHIPQRTHYAGSLRAEHIGQKVIINGWIDSNRDLGGLLFLDVRDREGVAQCVVEPSEATMYLYEEGKRLRSEFVVSIEGLVRKRSNPNSKMPTGQVEILISSIQVLNESEVPPFVIEEEVKAGEELRLKYRYLDLRRPSLLQNLMRRHKITQSIRNYFDAKGFVEVETPMLMKATPEGARDFLVPSRLHHGEFYALPQSPQIYKQILMVAGLDKYFQITKCFRDEDLRADRQPEFTQLDVEISFPDEEIVYEAMEGCLRKVWEDVGFVLPKFPRYSYKEVMERFGSDKPDLRFELEIRTLTDLLRGKTEFKVFNEALETKQGVIACIVAPGCAAWSRKQLDELTEHAKLFGAGGLVWLKVTDAGIDSSAKKFLSAELMQEIANASKASVGDLILIAVHQKWSRAYTIMGALRSEIAKRLKLTEGKAFEFAPLWVLNFPMFELDEATGIYNSMHHPFTSPVVEDWENKTDDLAAIRARAYDIVVNGYELGSGSIRIHDRKLQSEIFDMLGLSKEEQQKKFGFMLDAFRYGAPPHGGMALGIDRIAMLCCGTDNIKDVVAFPKTTSMQGLMENCPSPVDPRQLREVGIKLGQ
ncbi:MAG: aspartate--tRNA ligase [Bacteroidota bacterium]|nr:aspartate--tRNA ligase [Bacteroidota bacterium]MDP4231201.1 aspartate--tRNA ligase [Bacteroidota bacterium]MDP4235332.1 aspartate--tRNA ligase [Bacteroidota bacterium]